MPWPIGRKPQGLRDTVARILRSRSVLTKVVMVVRLVAAPVMTRREGCTVTVFLRGVIYLTLIFSVPSVTIPPRLRGVRTTLFRRKRAVKVLEPVVRFVRPGPSLRLRVLKVGLTLDLSLLCSPVNRITIEAFRAARTFRTDICF